MKSIFAYLIIKQGESRMDILVLNATNWIGYHVTERLLAEGYEVKAVKDPNGNEFLEEFFARNSNLEWVDTDQKGNVDIVICAFNPPEDIHYTYHRMFIINGRQAEFKNAIFCHAPTLFGKWMEFPEKNKRSDLKEDGIYMEDFLDVFIPWIESPPKQNEIHFLPSRKKGKILEKYCFVHENRPIEEKVEEVISHHERFQN
jgi:hypothetical protein